MIAQEGLPSRNKRSSGAETGKNARNAGGKGDLPEVGGLFEPPGHAGIPGVFPARRDAVAEIRHLTKADAERMLIDPDPIERALPVAARRRVEQYAEDMKAGRWILTGQPIVLQVLGLDRWRVVNGVKRLLALRKSGGSIPVVLVVFGESTSRLPPDALGIGVDSHRKRQTGDYISMLNPESPKTIAAALQHVWNWRKGHWERNQAKTTDLLDLYRRLRHIHDSQNAISENFAEIPAPRPMLIAWHAIAASVSPKDAQEFFAGVNDFAQLSPRDPRRVLAIRLAGIAEGEATVTRQTLHALFAKAWNAWRLHTRIQSLRMMPNEDMPTIDGWTGIDMLPPVDGKDDDLDRLFDLRKAIETRDVSAEIVTVTREGAENLLRLNTWNRKPSQATVRRYMRDMTAENWGFSGSSIIISRNGRMLDGQQRLMALMAVGKPQDFVLVRGVHEAAFSVIDNQNSRGVAHLLREGGITRAATLAGAINLLWRIENRKYFGGDIPSQAELLEVFRRHESGLRLAAMRRGSDSASGLTPAVAVALDFITYLESPDMAPSFWGKLNGLGEFQEGDPVLALRRKLDRNRMGAEVGKAPPRDRLLWAMTAWRAHLRGDRIRAFRVLDFDAAFGPFLALKDRGWN